MNGVMLVKLNVMVKVRPTFVCFLFVFLLFACFSLVSVRFVVEGSVERVLVMVTSSFLLFPFSRVSSALSPS